ncbi:MAG: TlpA family protein disulfide reductase [Patescibacteria group bacterium]|nr:TlpA family protein disulfide reductase [Patescibacteria group bacterium]MDE1946101.1 TlpA family protein disulfide reductase [Patescibacteria group bacterium]
MKYTGLIASAAAIIAAVFFIAYISGKQAIPVITGSRGAPAAAATSTDASLVGSAAPSFNLLGASGDSVSLSGFSGKPLVLIFWSSWSQPSLDELRIVSDYRANPDAAAPLVSFLAIDSEEDPSVALSLARRSGYNVPFALDSSGAVTENYRVTGLPETYFIDRSGVIRDVSAGVLGRSALVDKIENLVKQ